MIPKIIHVTEPIIGNEELEQLKEVIDSKYLTEDNKTKQFEEEFKKLAGAKHAIAYSNATMGLFAALKVLGIKPGDEVIIPDLTFVATCNAVIMAGATPIIVDVDKDTFNIAPELIENKITNKTKVIMPVHLYGQSADMDIITEIAKKHNLKVIEDAAQGIGVKFRGKHVGTFGDIGCFSFYGNKTITTGEGGMITTNDYQLATECYRLKNHGRDVKGVFKHKYIGYNFSFTEMQAAIGIAQLGKLNAIIKRKKEINDFYKYNLLDIKGIRFVYIDERCSPVYWLTSIMIEDTQKLEKLSEFLLKEGIMTRRFFYPLHKQECYTFNGDYPNSLYAYEHGLSLPSGANLSDETLNIICNKIKEYFARNK